MCLVGLHIYYKMIHGPYNVKFLPVSGFEPLIIQPVALVTVVSELPGSLLCLYELFGVVTDGPSLPSEHLTGKDTPFFPRFLNSVLQFVLSDSSS